MTETGRNAGGGYEAPRLIGLGGQTNATAACGQGSGNLDWCSTGLLAFGGCGSAGNEAIWTCNTSGAGNSTGKCEAGTGVTTEP